MLEYATVIKDYARVVNAISNALDIYEIELDGFKTITDKACHNITFAGEFYNFIVEVSAYRITDCYSKSIMLEINDTYCYIDAFEEVLKNYNNRRDKYKFITIKNLSNMIVEMYKTKNTDKVIDFTFDTEGNEPSGWYGAKLINVFDNYMAVFGYYGFDNSCSVPLYDDMDIDDLEYYIASEFTKAGFNDGYKTTENTVICIEK